MEQNQQGQDNNKVEKKYLSNFNKLIAMMGGKLPKTSKVPNDAVSSLVEELLAERVEASKVEFKKKASALLDRKIEFDKFVKQKQKELDDAILNKKKEFSAQMEEVFSIVENMDKMAKEYAGSLTDLATEQESEKKEDEETV